MNRTNHNMSEWQVRDGNEMDMGGILSLREIVFREEERDKLDPRFWRWEFIENPDGRASIYIVEDQRKIIAHFADIPRRFSVGGEAVLGTLSLDLMVHPDYWRKGIFQAMGKYAIQRVKNDNCFFMSSYPIRRETINGFKKIGWRKMVKLPVVVYPINFSGVINRYLRFQPLSLLIGGVARFFYFLLHGLKRKKRTGEAEIEKVDLLDDAFNGFWQKASTLYPILGIRDQNYLNWRYLRHPTRTYSIYRAKISGEMKGYIILRKVKLLNFDSTVIVDLLALDEATLIGLVEKGIEHSRAERTDLLGFMVPLDHLYYKILRRMGFLPSLKTFLFMVYPHSGKEILLSPEKWYVNWGDTDVI